VPQTIQRSFTSGEIAPSLQSRADITKYATGLNLCENFFIRAQGGAYSRPGFRFIGELGDSTKKGRLIPFSFNTEQTYILVFEHLKMRVIRDDGYVMDGASPYEIATPYTEAQLPRLGYTQSADVMTIVHPDHDPRNLSRLDHDDWTLAVIDYASSVTAPTISSVVAGGTGAGTYSKTYEYVVTAVDANGVESLASAMVSLSTNSLSTTAYNTVTWGTIAAAEYYRIYKNPSTGTGVFGWIGDSNNLTFDDYNIAPITSDAPPEDRQPFAGADNKPSTVNYYQQRQIFANTNNEPQVTFTTQVANYNSLRTSDPARDDDAVTFTIAAQQVNEIRHIISLDTLIMLTSGGEWVVTEGQDKVLTPSTIGVRIQSYNGSSWVKPVIINSTALYLQEKGARIRDLGYEFSSDKYTGNDLSLMSEHLFEDNEITDMAYANEPYGILWCVRDDGVMLGLTYQREHQVWGWHHHVTEGEFESVATISQDRRDAVFVIVSREIDGSTVRYIERLEKRESKDAEDAFYVDSGLSLDVPSTISGATQADPVVISDTGHPYSDGDLIDIRDVVGMTELNGNRYKVASKTANTYELTDEDDNDIDGTGFTEYESGGESREAVTTLSGLDHLEGEDVAVLADGYVVTGKTVASGSITLDRAASKVHVGLPYTPALETLDIDTSSPTDSLKALSLSVSKVYLEVEGTRGGFVGPRQDAETSGVITYQEVKPRFQSDDYDAIALKTYKQKVTIDPQWSKGGGLRVEQRVPLPMAILSIIPSVDVGGS